MLEATLARYRAAFSGLPRDVWLLAIVLLVNRVGTMALPFMTLYLTSERGMTEGAAGQMIGVYGIGAVAGAWLGGRLTQSFGAVRVQAASLLLSAPAFLAIPAWRSSPAIAASLFVLGLVAEALRPANATAITQLTTGENRAKAFGVARLAINLGFSIGPMIGGVLATVDFRLLFIVDAATSLAAGAAVLYLFRGRSTVSATSMAPIDRSWRTSPLRDGVFVAHLALVLASLMVFFQFGSTYPLYLRDHFGMAKPQIGLMFAVNTVVIVFFEILVLDLIQRWPLVRTIGWGYFLACVGFGILPFGSTGGYAVLAMLLVTVGEMLAFSLSTSFAASRSATGDESRYMGWYVVVTSMAIVLGPAIGSAIYAVDRTALWITCLVVGAAVLVGFHILSLWSRADVCEAPA